MATKLFKKDNKHKAKIVTENQKPCAFCHRQLDDEINYGKLYAIGDIQCHYFCVLLSCCLVQKGPDTVGLLGFLYLDILAELERCKKHRCSYCGQGGASIGCDISTCRKQFHLPCGRERDAVSLFYGTYKSFCIIHAPKQKIPEHIMSKAKIRMKQEKQMLKKPDRTGEVEKCGIGDMLPEKSEEMVCVICYEEVNGFPSLHTFWPPCCARDAWFHRTCLQRMALAAGMHYLKCPLCNDKDTFYDSVVGQGYYVPDRDAAWELEQNAFSEIYERPIICGADECLCPLGRKHDAENGPWDIKLCLLCGSVGRHAKCATDMFVCETCKPVAPTDLDDLANKIDNIIQQEQTQVSANRRHGPVMPSRMSLRRTKGREPLINRPSSSRPNADQTESQNTLQSRLELNLKPPRKPSTTSKDDVFKKPSPRKTTAENDGFFSPNKLITGLKQKGVNLDEKVVEKIRRKILKPRPLSVKRRIVNETLNGLLKDNPLKEPKQKDHVKEWVSPKKHEIDNIEEIQSLYHVSTPQKNSKTATSVEKSKSSQKSPKSVQKDPISENTELKSFQEEQILENTEPKSAQNEPILEDIQPKSAQKELTLEQEPKSAQKDPIVENIDETSTSTFELPAEFVADVQSDDSCHFDTQKSKTIDIKHDSSLEIFEKDETIGIDVIKVENTDLFDKIFNFSPLSECKTKNMDIENFKKEYLNEVKTKSEDLDSCTKFSTPEKEKNELSNCQKDVKKRGKKRCRPENIQNTGPKKRKMSENNLILHYPTSPVKNNKNEEKDKKSKLRKKKNKKNRSKKNLKLTFDSETKTKNKKTKLKTKFSINNKKIKLKIQWKKEHLSFELESNKKEKRIKTKKEKKLFKNNSSNLKQYILHCPSEGTSKDIKDVLIKPENEIKNIKTKKIKLEKTPDKFKQTSLHSFFKVKSPNDK